MGDRNQFEIEGVQNNRFRSTGTCGNVGNLDMIINKGLTKPFLNDKHFVASLLWYPEVMKAQFLENANLAIVTSRRK